MNAKFDPAPRPALRKAPDADVHPTTFTSAIATSGDSVLEGKKVEISARIPKKLRKEMRKAAKAASISTDEFITIAIASELQNRSRSSR